MKKASKQTFPSGSGAGNDIFLSVIVVGRCHKFPVEKEAVKIVVL